MKWIKGVAAIISMGLFLAAVSLTFFFLWIDNFLGMVVNYISGRRRR